MKLAEAQALADLRSAGQAARVVAKCKTAAEVTADIYAEAESRGEPFARTPESWTNHWLPSKKFHLVRMPLNAAAMPCQPKIGNLVLKKIHAREDTPIVVDYNQNQVGKAMHGFVPEVIVIDGKHRYQAAHLRGESHIMAYVGEEAMQAVPSLQACGCGKKMSAGGPGSGRHKGSGTKMITRTYKTDNEDEGGDRYQKLENLGYEFAEDKGPLVMKHPSGAHAELKDNFDSKDHYDKGYKNTIKLTAPQEHHDTLMNAYKTWKSPGRSKE